MKNYIGNCINPPIRIERLVEITENAISITKQEFLDNCYVPEEMEEMLNDNYTSFYKYDSVYFFTHSAIEYLFE